MVRYNHLQESVTNFSTVIVLMMISILFSGNAFAEDATLSWNPSAGPNLAGYSVYFGTSSGSYGTSIDVGNQTTYTVTGLGNGTYYFAVTAYDTFGNQSDFSNEAIKTIAGIQSADSSGSSNSSSGSSNKMSGGCGMVRPTGGTPPGPGQAADLLILPAFLLVSLVLRRRHSIIRLSRRMRFSHCFKASAGFSHV